ncbi:hypothetical protein G5714_007767 [Onychostoma macrolepis]|uniref:Uncharacterized protein n=1 Tax=Onychostoma macrolepis TaxID=369639 RepID=A0A7J6CTU2_9TELE|nr:hypothetical protein G5714_007767 [Onychostoma macrolepis]
MDHLAPWVLMDSLGQRGNLGCMVSRDCEGNLGIRVTEDPLVSPEHLAWTASQDPGVWMDQLGLLVQQVRREIEVRRVMLVILDPEGHMGYLELLEHLEWINKPANMGPAGNLFNIRQGDQSNEEYTRDFFGVACRSATEKTCLMVIFWGGLAEPYKSLMPYWAPEESLEDYINLALHLSGSAFGLE